MADKSLRQKLTRRWSELERERSSYIDHWRELQEYIVPRRGRFLTSERNDGKKKHNRILDSAGTLAARTLASGMMAGLTSPARPWFRLATPDPDLADFGPVKEWLYAVELRLREIFARSNIYNALHMTYKEIGVFGTGPLVVAESFTDVIRGYPVTVGSYALDISEELEVDTMYREVPMSVKMIVERFGIERVSRRVKRDYEEGNLAAEYVIMHAIEPNVGDLGYDGPELKFIQDKPFRSMYWEKATDSDGEFPGLLLLSGYNERPMLGPRWDVTGTDIYGSSPGMDALGDVKQLQTQQKWKGEGISKQVRPPMVAPEALRHKSKTTVPGGVTYYDSPDGMRGFEPAFKVDFDLRYLIEDIRETRERISRAFYEDLFLMLAQSDRRQITAREIEERHEEKLLMLGPVLERLEDELLDPLIDRTFAVALRNGLLPDPPPDLEDTELKVEYISILAQAQKAVAVNTLERTATFLGGLAQVQAASGQPPSVLDKFDFDEAIDEFADAIGLSPNVIVPDEEVHAERQARVQAQEQQQRMQQMAAAAEMAQKAGQVKTDERNMASDAVAMVTGQNPATPGVGQR